MKRIIIGLLILIPFIGFSQPLAQQQQGDARNLTNQFGYFIDMNGRQLPTYSTPPTAKTGSKGTVVRVSMYKDSATGNIRMLNASGAYSSISDSTATAISVLAQKNRTDSQVNVLNAQISAVASGFQGSISLASAAPPINGVYFFSQSGTYTNFGNVVVDLTQGLVYGTKQGSVYTSTVIPISLTGYYTKIQTDSFVKYIGATATSGVDFTDSLVNQAANNPTAYLNYTAATLNGAILQSVKFSAKEVGSLLVVQLRKQNSSGYYQEINRFTLTTAIGKNTINMTSYNAVVNTNDIFAIADFGATNTPKRRVVAGKSVKAIGINGTTNLYEFTDVNFPTEPVSPTNSQIDLQFTYKIPDNDVKGHISVLESQTSTLNNAASTAVQSQNIGVDNNGTNALTSGTGLCFSTGSDTLLTGTLGIVKFSATGTGKLLFVQMRKTSTGNWTQTRSDTLTTATGENTIDLTGLNISVIKDDYFGLAPLGSVNPRWKSVVGAQHWEAVYNSTIGKYTFSDPYFPNTKPTPDNVEVDLSYVVTQASQTAIQLANNNTLYIAATNSRVDKIENGVKTTLIRVSKYGVVGVDSIQYIGNRAIQDALDHITDASYENRYIIYIMNPSVFEAKTASDFNAGTPATGADICFIRPKDWVTVRGCNYATCVISGFLPNNLGTGFAYQNYQTIKWGCNNFKLENVTVTGQNLRYAVHIDNGSFGNADYKMEMSNCVFEHLGNTSDALTVWNSPYAVGIGTSSGQQLIYDNCTFKSPLAPLQMHTSFKTNKPSLQKYTNCTFWNTGSNNTLANEYGYLSHQQDIVQLSNCSFINCFIFNNGEDSRFAPALSDLKWDAYEVKYTGSGNDPMLFKNGYGHACLQIKSKSTGGSSIVSFDTTSSAYSIIIKDKDYSTGGYKNIVNETISGYAQRNGETGLSGYAVGLLDINNDAQNGLYLKSLGKRLGDCSTANKSLGINVDGTSYTVTFNKNYNGTSTSLQPNYTNDSIVKEITNVIGTVATVQWLYPISSLNTYGEFTDLIKNATSSELILKGFGVVIENGLARKALSTDTKIDGIALNDFTTGGTGRVLVKGIIETAQFNLQFIKLESGTAAVVKGDSLGVSSSNAGQFNKTASFKPFACKADGYLWVNCQ